MGVGVGVVFCLYSRAECSGERPHSAARLEAMCSGQIAQEDTPSRRRTWKEIVTKEGGKGTFWNKSFKRVFDNEDKAVLVQGSLDYCERKHASRASRCSVPHRSM